MKKEDMRVLVTKRLLTEALIQLLKEKKPENISIKELTDTAGINRGSFYQHYKSIEELVDEINDAIIEECFSDGKTQTEFTLEAQNNAINKTYDYIYKNKEYMAVMFKAYGSYALNEKIKNKIKPYIVNSLTVLSKGKMDPEVINVLYYYIYGGCSQILDSYLSGTANITFDQVRKYCGLFSKKIINEYLIDNN